MPEVKPDNSADKPKQRKSPRARFFSTINMVFVDSKSGARLSGQEHFRIHRADIKDLSSTAMMIRTCDFNPQLEPQLLSGEVVISLKFSLPGQTSHIDTMVQVTRVNKETGGAAVFYNIGVKFLQIRPMDQAAIDRYLRGYGKKDI
jgi:c-di-GMP-binding flagellar brake protein YcgR